jgi:hypothetical protein
MTTVGRRSTSAVRRKNELTVKLFATEITECTEGHETTFSLALLT